VHWKEESVSQLLWVVPTAPPVVQPELPALVAWVAEQMHFFFDGLTILYSIKSSLHWSIEVEACESPNFSVTLIINYSCIRSISNISD